MELFFFQKIKMATMQRPKSKKSIRSDVPARLEQQTVSIPKKLSIIDEDDQLTAPLDLSRILSTSGQADKKPRITQQNPTTKRDISQQWKQRTDATYRPPPYNPYTRPPPSYASAFGGGQLRRIQNISSIPSQYKQQTKTHDVYRSAIGGAQKSKSSIIDGKDQLMGPLDISGILPKQEQKKSKTAPTQQKQQQQRPKSAQQQQIIKKPESFAKRLSRLLPQPQVQQVKSSAKRVSTLLQQPQVQRIKSSADPFNSIMSYIEHINNLGTKKKQQHFSLEDILGLFAQVGENPEDIRRMEQQSVQNDVAYWPDKSGQQIRAITQPYNEWLFTYIGSVLQSIIDKDAPEFIRKDVIHLLKQLISERKTQMGASRSQGWEGWWGENYVVERGQTRYYPMRLSIDYPISRLARLIVDKSFDQIKKLADISKMSKFLSSCHQKHFVRDKYNYIVSIPYFLQLEKKMPEKDIDEIISHILVFEPDCSLEKTFFGEEELDKYMELIQRKIDPQSLNTMKKKVEKICKDARNRLRTIKLIKDRFIEKQSILHTIDENIKTRIPLLTRLGIKEPSQYTEWIQDDGKIYSILTLKQKILRDMANLLRKQYQSGDTMKQQRYASIGGGGSSTKRRHSISKKIIASVVPAQQRHSSIKQDGPFFARVYPQQQQS